MENERILLLKQLSKQYPTIKSVYTEIINLEAILNLPKGTEHFMSDLHGEYEAFNHICSNASGVIREKIDISYSNLLSAGERAVLATLIYYPREKLKELTEKGIINDEWYKITLNRLVDVCRNVASKYTRSKVRKTLPTEFMYIIEELLHSNYNEKNKEEYYENILTSIINTGAAEDFVFHICETIKKLVVDRLHIVGDIFDRGPRADIVMNRLVSIGNLDIQWGNHDVLWMGAAAGSTACIAIVLNNSLTYNNTAVIETGYGISLRELSVFANETYQNSDLTCFMPRGTNLEGYSKKALEEAARMHKAIAIIQFKLEGQLVKRNPDFAMEDTLLLHKIDYKSKTVEIDGRKVSLKDCDFPTVNIKEPYKLTADEEQLMESLRSSFHASAKLQYHVKFLYTKGAIYTVYNSNLMFHGCVPLDENGDFMSFKLQNKKLSGKKLMDYCDSIARHGFFSKPESKEKQQGEDFLWFLWNGRNSPVFGRDKMATFSRLLTNDEQSKAEPKNSYYKYIETEETCKKILTEFALCGDTSHIINGHIPVKTKDGETPVKAGGKLIVIDGGFCRAYQKTTGIAGYTLIYNSWGIRIVSHEPFKSKEDSIKNNKDILSKAVVFDRAQNRIKVEETDIGADITQNITALKKLLEAYQDGIVKER